MTDGRKYRVQFPTKHSINPKHWSKNANTVKRVLSAESNSVEINSYLQELSVRALKIYNDATNENIIPDARYFRDELKPKQELKKLTFWEAWEAFEKAKSSEVASSTLIKIKTTKKHIQKFNEEILRRSISFERIEKTTLEDFFSFLAQSMADRSNAKYVKILKGFLNWCYDRRYMTNDRYKTYKAKGVSDTLKITLNDSELDRIRSFNYQGKEHLRNASKLFLLSCLTGLRFSDYTTIKTEHLKEQQGEFYLSKHQAKTSDKVEIPLTPEAKEIVDAIISKEVRIITNQKMNDYLKDLCELVGIDEPFEKVTCRGGKKVVTSHPKYELISTHTGRRTFATNLMLKGVAPEIVMEFTGHKDYASFAKYVNIPKISKMQIARNAILGEKMRVA